MCLDLKNINQNQSCSFLQSVLLLIAGIVLVVALGGSILHDLPRAVDHALGISPEQAKVLLAAEARNK